jgi:hypothetical protein
MTFPPLWPPKASQPCRVSPNRALCDLPQIILAAYFLSKSFGDCLPEEGVPGRGVCKLANCKLTSKSALMIILSLATSAAYFGCTNGIVRWKLPFDTSHRTVHSTVRLAVQTKSSRSRASSSSGARRKSSKTVACSAAGMETPTRWPCWQLSARGMGFSLVVPSSMLRRASPPRAARTGPNLYLASFRCGAAQ